MNYNDNMVKYTLDEIKKGYHLSDDKNCYVCNFCGKSFTIGEIYQINSHFYDCIRAIKIHIIQEHDSVVQSILSSECQYVTFTKKQIQQLKYIYQNMTDIEIAKIMNISPSTVRHQKFVLREKAKQAKMSLAVYELVFQDQKKDLIEIPKSARMVDDRFMIAQKENELIVHEFFSSLEPLILTQYPTKAKKKIVVLQKIANEFEAKRTYTEKEVNVILKSIFEVDYVTLRRELIDYGFMKRSNDCAKYWKE
jgi:hypothetical protein